MPRLDEPPHKTNGKPVSRLGQHFASRLLETPPVPGEKKDTSTQFSAAGLMAMDLPEPRCVVAGIIAEGLSLLVSRPKLGKSWLALAISIAIANGKSALGTLPTHQGDVLYLALEDNRRRLKSRLSKLLAGSPAPKNLTLATEWPRFDDGGLDKSREWIKSVECPRLIVIDTLAKVRGRTSRGSDVYAEDYRAAGEIKSLADEYGIGILAVHHVRKMAGDDLLDEVSGSIGITGAADTILILKRERGQHDACLYATGRVLTTVENGGAGRLNVVALGC